jgi:hypothetical protein
MLMYLTHLEVAQISPPSYSPVCDVEVSWQFDRPDTDVMEIWWKGGSDDRWTWVPPHVPIDDGQPTSVEVTVPAGVPGMIIACPRLLEDDGSLAYRQPDHDGEEQIWNGFCLFAQFVGERLDGEPPDRCGTAPQITAMDVGPGSVTVKWTNPEGYDRFEVELVRPGGGASTHRTEHQLIRFDRLATGGYWAKVRGVHDGNAWTGTRDCASPWSRVRETSLPPELGYVEARFTPGTPLATVKQHADHAELFACLPDGRPVGIWSDDPPRWHAWYGHGHGPGFPGGAPLTALSRAAGFMDVFGVASDGRVHLAWWHGNPWREWFVLSDPVFPPGAHIAALCRNSDQMDIFATGTDGVVRSNWWNGDPWRDWFILTEFWFPPGCPIAALSRNSDQMDIFAVDVDGVMRSNWWNGNPWRGWFELGDASFPPGAHVAAVSRNSDQMDIFAVDVDGVMRSNWWNGNPWRGWFELAGETFTPGGSVCAIAPTADLMQVVAVGNDGRARLNEWNGDWSGWAPLDGADFPTDAIISALRGEGAFGVATDGYVRGNQLRRSPSWYRVR